MQMFFEIGVLKHFAIFSVKYLCWSLFFSYQKETPTQVLSCENSEIFENSFFIEELRRLILKGAIMNFLLESFQIVESCIKNQNLNISIKGGDETCMSVLWFYLMLNKNFNKNSFKHPDLTYFLAEQNYKEMKKTCVLKKISMNRN